MGALWQVLCDLRYALGFVPIMVNDLSVQGYSLLSGPLPAAVLLRLRWYRGLYPHPFKRRRSLALCRPPVFAGVTEPLVYGVNLQCVCHSSSIAGGAIGGAIAAMGGSASDVFAIPHIALPTTSTLVAFAVQVIGIVVLRNPGCSEGLKPPASSRLLAV